MKTYLFVYAGAVLLAMGFTPLVIYIARNRKIFDRTDARKVHAGEIARIGGIAFFLAFMLMILPVFWLDNTIGESFRRQHRAIAALLGAGTFIFLLGLVDDLHHLRVWTKFIGQILAAIVVCYFGIVIEKIAIPGFFDWQLGWLGWPLTIIWIVGVTNAMNLIDGLDGLAAGISAITCGVITIFALYYRDAEMAVLMLALLGGLTGFLMFNFNPARIFMGDCGSLFLGFMLAASSVFCAVKSATLVGMALPALALGVPIFDTLFSMLRRVLERRSMFSPDRGHIHHQLLDRGLRQHHVVLIIYGVTLLSAGFGLFMMVTKNSGILLVFLCVLLQILLVFRFVGVIRLREALEGIKRNYQVMRNQSEQKREFDQALLEIRYAGNFQHWWEGLCKAGEEMGLVYISMRLLKRDGTEVTQVWRNSKLKQWHDLIEVAIPVAQRRANQKLQLDIAVPVTEEMESSGNTVSLFIRLVQQYNPATLSPRRISPDIDKDTVPTSINDSKS